jgi:hypothetical protein
MMLRISCPGCGHVGLTVAEHLPAELVCWQCGSGRHIEADQGRAIYSQDRFAEWLAGERERPQVRSKVAALGS